MGEYENPEAAKAASQEVMEKEPANRETLVNILDALGIKYEKAE